MDFEDFRARGKDAVDFICDFSAGLEGKPVLPEVENGYMAHLLPKEAPKNAENFDIVLKDIQDKILPGITQGQHSGFHAYFPTGRGYPSLIADMISNALGCVGHSWMTSPACTELETIVLDWLGKALSIPPHFLYSTPGSIGGGVIQCSTSDCILVSMLAARSEAIKYLKETNDKLDMEDNSFLPQLVAYTSREAHPAVERSANIAMVKLRILEVDDQCSLRGPTLADAIHYDQDRGLHPFFVSCTLGTYASCGFDNLKEIGPIVKKHPQCWLHVDGSYAGSGFICPELRYLKEGMEFADSFNISCNKWLTVTYDCSCLWVKDRSKLTRSLITDPVRLHQEQFSTVIDYRNWGIQMSRSFRALKLWMTFRLCGTDNLQNYIRNHCKLAKEFEELVTRDGRFELWNDVRVGLVCFRLKGSNEINQDLLASINKEGKIHMIPAIVRNKYVIRFCVTHPNATREHIDFAWSVIQKHTSDLLERERGEKPPTMTEDERKRHSFILPVPQDLFDMHRTGLKDVSFPIYVSASGKLSEHSKQVSDEYFEVY